MDNVLVIWLLILTVLVAISFWKSATVNKNYYGEITKVVEVNRWELQEMVDEAFKEDNAELVKKLVKQLNEYQINKS